MSKTPLDQYTDFARRYEDELRRLDCVRTFCGDAENAVWWLSGQMADLAMIYTPSNHKVRHAGSAPDVYATLPWLLDLQDEVHKAARVLMHKGAELRARHRAVAQEAARVTGLDWSWEHVRWRPGISDEEAESALRFLDVDATGDAAERIRLKRAGHVLFQLVRRLKVELAQEQARAETSGRQYRRGMPLHDEMHPEGRRLYLDGTPLHAGDRLSLLTTWGWIDGRFESGNDGDPLFLCGLVPGSDHETCLPVTPEMRFSRPE